MPLGGHFPWPILILPLEVVAGSDLLLLQVSSHSSLRSSTVAAQDLKLLKRNVGGLKNKKAFLG